jgi:hypothetical protein
MRQYGADELVDPELGGLEVHVDVDEGGGERRSADVYGLVRLARAPTRDGPVCNGEIGCHPFSCAGHEDAATFEKEICRLVTARHSQYTWAPAAWWHWRILRRRSTRWSS